MVVKFVESCAGSNFVFSVGAVVDSNDEGVDINVLKDQVRAGHAVEITGNKVERATSKTVVETR